MAIKDALDELQDFDVNDLDFENMGSWPILVKGIILVSVFGACLMLGYFYDIADLQLKLDQAVLKETTLKTEFSANSHKAANLDAYRQQMVDMETSFGALVSQLPSDTEVPGLLEDITNKGIENGLEMTSIKLQTEVVQEFYIELPISISVVGSYHDLATFVSGIAGLPRIVTLHDFSIVDQGDGTLRMDIIAKTYRYKDLEV